MSTIASDSDSSTPKASTEPVRRNLVEGALQRLQPVLLAIWHFATVNRPASLIPPPYDVWQELKDLAVGGVNDDAYSRTLHIHLLASIGRVYGGFALALAVALAGTKSISALAGDTDGTDGGSGRPDDPAGAYIDHTTLSRAERLGLDAAHYLDDNNSTEFFEKLGDLLVPGPTLTNVNDFRAILVDSP